MDKDLEKAIKSLAKKAETETNGPVAMNFAQAALNLAHVVATLAGAKALR